MMEFLKIVIITVSLILIVTTLSVIVVGIAGLHTRKLHFSQVFWRVLAACLIVCLLYFLMR